MCNFFSAISDGKGKTMFFKPEDVVKIMAEGNPNKYDFNSHSSICSFHGLEGKIEDRVNKWEYNPEDNKLSQDTLNSKDDSASVKEKLKMFFDGVDISYLRGLYDSKLIIGGDLAEMTGGYGSKMTGGNGAEMTGGDFAKMTGGNFAKMTGGNGAKMTGGKWSNMTGGEDANMTGGNGAKMTGGKWSNMTGGNGAEMTGGDFAKMTGGNGAKMTGGYGSKMKCGKNGTLILKFYDGKRNRYKIGYIGEAGLKPNVFYKLNDDFEFEEVD